MDSVIDILSQSRANYITTNEACLLDSLERMACRSASPSLLSRALLWKVRMQISTADVDTLSAWLNKASVNLSESDTGLFKLITGMVKLRCEEYSEAFKSLSEAAEIYRAEGNNLGRGLAIGNIGHIYERLGDKDKAYKNFNEASHLFESAEAKRLSLHNELNLVNVTDFRNSTVLAKQLDSLATVALGCADSSFVVNVMLTRTSYQPHDTVHTIRTLLMAQQTGYQDEICPALINHAQALIANNRYTEALVYLQRAKMMSDSIGLTRLKPVIMDCMSQAYELLDSADKALELLRERDIISNSQLKENKIESIYTEEFTKNIEEYQKRLEAEQRLSKQFSYILILVIILMCGGVLWVVTARRSAKHKNRLKAEIMDLKLREAEFQKKQMQQQIEIKNRELTTRSLNISYKNDLLQRIIEGGENLSVKDIIRELKAQISIDNEWENFRIIFEEIHPGFARKIKAEFPCISDNEIRLCAMTVIGLSIKQISMMLAITPESVQKARYRLKKKLGLTLTDSLDQKLNSFCNPTV